MNPWVGVDLDGTLAHYVHFQGPGHIGEPIQPMLEFVAGLLDNEVEVRIFTARVGLQQNPEDIQIARSKIGEWCLLYLGVVLPVTCEKDYGMVRLYDDRCVTVEKNTGRFLTEGFEHG
jgi:hypothetical protein